jgi:hypothetical protein
MKVRVVLEIEVDPALWADTAGCARADVRQDVKTYVRHQVDGAAMLDETGAEVALR